jgi:hypothetical protein
MLSRWVVIGALMAFAAGPTGVYAQATQGSAAAGSTTAAATPAAQATPADQNPPAAVGEEGKKETRGFVKALGHNLVDDLKHIPRLNSVYWLAGGGAAALLVHQDDNKINGKLAGSKVWDRVFLPGQYVGSTYVILGGATATYFLSRHEGWTRGQHLGMDIIESTLIAEAYTQGLKLAVRRDRPIQSNGQQSSTYSFPSGHATLTFAAATVLQQHLGYKAAIPTYLIASYVAMSRLHDNRHYASDVVFGAASGVMIGRSVTWHGRNFYASPMLVPGGGGIQMARR